ncbi:hypothetical protein [Streptomyces pseudogriseolus]|uniref:hypothetical protein n=1 Tax=Streptomyces pseudogriseolus TaxID=36817 RepID=UPI003FA25AB1
MDEIESVAVGEKELNGLGLYELERVSGLRRNVNAHHLKARVAVSLTRSPLAAVKVK